MGPSEPLKQCSPFPSPRAGTFQILRVHLGRRVGQTPSSSGFGKALWYPPALFRISPDGVGAGDPRKW